MPRSSNKLYVKVLEYFKTAPVAEAELVLDLAKKEIASRQNTIDGAVIAAPTASAAKAKGKPGPKPKAQAKQGTAVAPRERQKPGPKPRPKLPEAAATAAPPEPPAALAPSITEPELDLVGAEG